VGIETGAFRERNDGEDDDGFGIAFRPLSLSLLSSRSSSLFRKNPRAGRRVTILANRGIGIPLLLHAREGVSYLRPSLNSPSVKSDQRSPARSPSLPLFLFLSSFVPPPLILSSPWLSRKLARSFSSFLPSSLFLLFNFHRKPRTTAIIRTVEDPGRSSKIAFRR